MIFQSLTDQLLTPVWVTECSTPIKYNSLPLLCPIIAMTSFIVIQFCSQSSSTLLIPMNIFLLLTMLLSLFSSFSSAKSPETYFGVIDITTTWAVSKRQTFFNFGRNRWDSFINVLIARDTIKLQCKQTTSNSTPSPPPTTSQTPILRTFGLKTNAYNSCSYLCYPKQHCKREKEIDTIYLTTLSQCNNHELFNKVLDVSQYNRKMQVFVSTMQQLGTRLPHLLTAQVTQLSETF